MVKPKFLTPIKTLLVTVLMLLGLTGGHMVLPASSMSPDMDMMGHGQKTSVQCQSTCNTALPWDKQDLLTARKINEDPAPQPAYALLLASGGLALLFILPRSAKRSETWRPPDLISLYGQLKLYA